jgi:sec-independent protein translocase protein TatA
MAPLAIMGLSIQELMVILLIVLLLFGAKKIPEIARGLGEGIRGFRSTLKGDDAESESSESKDADADAKSSRP